MTELLWRVSGPTGQAPQNPHSSASSPQALSAGAWGLTQCCSPSQPQSSRGWKKGECVPNWPDLLPTPWPWPSLNPFSLSSLSKSLFLSVCFSPSPGWLFLLLSLCPNMQLPLLTSSQALSSLFSWVFLLKFLAAGEQLRFTEEEQSRVERDCANSKIIL